MSLLEEIERRISNEYSWADGSVCGVYRIVEQVLLEANRKDEVFEVRTAKQ